MALIRQRILSYGTIFVSLLILYKDIFVSLFHSRIMAINRYRFYVLRTSSLSILRPPDFIVLRPRNTMKIYVRSDAGHRCRMMDGPSILRHCRLHFSTGPACMMRFTSAQHETSCTTRLLYHETLVPRDSCATRLLCHETSCTTRLLYHETLVPRDFLLLYHETRSRFRKN